MLLRCAETVYTTERRGKAAYKPVMSSHQSLSAGVSGDVPSEAASDKRVTAVTHNGVFHADDVFAVAALEILHPWLRLVRTRDEAVIATADYVVDVGGVYDPADNRFDHHQRGRAGARDNGVLYSSFGLVWKKFGPGVVEALGVRRDAAEHVAALVDEALVQGIDALDNGQGELLGAPGLVQPLSISHLISGTNPVWCEDASPKAFDDAFWLAASVARFVLEREVASAWAKVRAEERVLEAVRLSRGSRIILLLSGGMPWQETVVNHAPEAWFVVFQSPEGTWMAQCVPDALGSFGKRKALPEEWAGLRDAEFQARTGVKDGVFCHPGLFICGAASQEGALELALLAVER